MGVNSLPKTVIRQHRGCDLNPGPSAPESSTLTTRLPLCLHLSNEQGELSEVIMTASQTLFRLLGLHITIIFY